MPLAQFQEAMTRADQAYALHVSRAAEAKREPGRHQIVRRREARTLPHRREDRVTQSGSTERARLALTRLFPLEPLTGDRPRRTRQRRDYSLPLIGRA